LALFLSLTVRTRVPSVTHGQLRKPHVRPTRILYALPAWGVFASVGQIGRIDAFLLRRAYKCGFSKDLYTFQELLHDWSPVNCLGKCSPQSIWS